MKLHSQKKRVPVQLRVNTDEEVKGLLEQYVVYANEVHGEKYEDIWRAFRRG